MSWIKLEEVHRCNFPEYDHEEQHKVGELWRCDEPWCHRIWRLTFIQVTPTTKYKNNKLVYEGIYDFTLLDFNELKYWR